ncbi:unnamed protein product [Protopolystoma xenopodis]|uniref:Uncharacterized protein n=1 Tax=Protopolystoma xenopodis TaxID=117903 RepID=A0A3S4ZTG8_9PLAT|nr:unnamed protein product [Protopolystoma xenopodis]
MGVLTATSHHVTVAPTSANTATVGALTHTPAQQVATLSPCQLASMPSPAPVSSSNPAGVGHASAIAVGSSACAGLISRASTDRLFNSVQAGIPPTAVSANFPTSVSVPIDAIIGHHGQHHHPGHAYNPPASGPSIHEHSTIAGIAAGSLRLISHPIAMTAAASSSGPGTPVTFALVPSSLAGPTTAFVTNCLQTPITANPLASSLHDFATRHRAHFSAETARAVPPTCIGIYGPHHSSPAAVVTSHVSAPVSLSLNAGTTITSAAGNLVYHHHPQGQTAIPHLTGHAFISPHHSLIQHHASLQEAQAALPQQLQQQHFCRQPATGAHVMVTGALIKTGHP